MTTKQTPVLSRRRALQGVAAGAITAIGGVGSTVAKPGKGAGPAQQCDHVVPTDFSTIQAAVDAASAGDTICVEPGTYEETVSVDTGVSIRGRAAANSQDATVVDGWLSLNAEGATVSRLVVTRSQPAGGSVDPFGIRVQASNTAVRDSILHGLTDKPNNMWGSINAIQVFANSPISNVHIENNTVRDIDKSVVGGIAGVKVQADASDVTVAGNTVSDLHSSGWAWGVVLTTSSSASGYPSAVTIEDNHLEAINDGSVYAIVDTRDGVPYPGSAVGIDGNAKADEATVVGNNLLAPNGVESKDDDNTLVAECNWWGDASGPTHDDNPDGTGTWALERGSASVDYSPWLTAPAPSNACNGTID